MKLEQSIRPHHHLVIWVASFLLVLTSVVLYLNKVAQQALAAKTRAIPAFMASNTEAIHLQLPPACDTSSSKNNDSCNKAMVAQSEAHIKNVLSKTDDHLATLDRIDTLVAKVEATLPQLQAAGLTPDEAGHLKQDVADIKNDSGRLRDYFTHTRSFMQQFVVLANSDTLKASALKQQPIAAESANAAATTDALARSLNDVIATLDKTQ